MIRVAICDDLPAELESVSQFLLEYARLHPEYDITTFPYNSPHHLLSALDRGQQHEIYILDIIMPGMSGIELGRAIRRANHICTIIFCTVSPEYALESYHVQAQNYLLKPFQPKTLFQSLTQAIHRLQLDLARGISFRAGTGVVFLPFHDIVYIESVRRRMVFHCTDGKTITSLALRGSLENALSDLLSDPRFFQPHKSFVVNMHHIRLLLEANITLGNGVVIPIASRRQSDALDRYLDFLSSRRVHPRSGTPAPSYQER